MNTTMMLQRLQRNSKQLQKLLVNGKFNQLSFKKRQQWLQRLELLQQRLSKFGQFHQVRKAIAGTGFVLSMALGNTANAQYFNPVQTNPFGLAGGTTTPIFPTYGDIDNDGDIDILTGNVPGTVDFFKNNGTSSTPSFSKVTSNSPLVNVTGYSFALPTLVDIDNDGDLDLFVTEYYGNTQYYQNTGTATSPSFATAQSTPFGINTLNLSSFIHLNFADMDNDGDKDIIAGSYYGTVYYFQNTGTATNAMFAAPVTNPFGMSAIQNSIYSFPALTDIDGDGDIDMFVGVYNGDVLYYQNTGTATVPAFGASQSNPFGIGLNGLNSDFVIPIFVDLDNDADVDLLAGTYMGNFAYQENTLIAIPNNVPLTADTAITINQDEVFYFDAANFPFNDADAGQSLTTIRFTSVPSNGVLGYGGSPIVVSQEIPVSNLNLVAYQPQTGQFGANYANFQFQVTEGIDYSTIQTFTINVNALPSTIQTTVHTFENVDYIFNVSDFTFNDPDNGTFDAIQILSLPAKGVIKLNGVAVVAGQEIATADFSNLVYSPLPNEHGFPYTNFLFAVGDGYGFSQPATLNIQVNFPVSTNAVKDFAAIQLAPNPATAIATLRIDAKVTTSATLTVQNFAGQTVLNEIIQLNGNTTQTIDVSNWTKGFYIVHLQTTEGEIWTEKLMVD